jgi:hypothetical protein
VSVSNSTVSLNTATDYAGGIYTSQLLDVRNSTISGNTARYGGGIDAGSANLVATTVTGNTATDGGRGGGMEIEWELTLTNSIIGNNTGKNCVYDTLVDNGGNLTDDDTCSTVPNALTGLDPTLQDNGGPTMTHALTVPSSAIGNAGNCGLFQGVFADQRGALRDTNCDSGAFEYGADDRYEISGSSGHDDSCPGHRIPFGQREHRLHTTDIDYVRFRSNPGSTYEIETTGLIGGDDTVLTLYKACGAELDEDDDGGGGVASKITYTAVSGDDELDVAVSHFSDLYAIGKGYDLSVMCTNSCPPCTLNGGNEYTLEDERVLGYRLIQACDLIIVKDSTIYPFATANLRAGNTVEFWDGFQVRANGQLFVAVDEELQ